MLNKFQQCVKLQKVIESCKTSGQIGMAEGMARRFLSIYNDRKLSAIIKKDLNRKRTDLGMCNYPVWGSMYSYYLDYVEIPKMPNMPKCKPPKKPQSRRI